MMTDGSGVLAGGGTAAAGTAGEGTAAAGTTDGSVHTGLADVEARLASEGGLASSARTDGGAADAAFGGGGGNALDRTAPWGGETAGDGTAREEAARDGAGFEEIGPEAAA